MASGHAEGGTGAACGHPMAFHHASTGRPPRLPPSPFGPPRSLCGRPSSPSLWKALGGLPRTQGPPPRASSPLGQRFACRLRESCPDAPCSRSRGSRFCRSRRHRCTQGRGGREAEPLLVMNSLTMMKASSLRSAMPVVPRVPRPHCACSTRGARRDRRRTRASCRSCASKAGGRPRACATRRRCFGLRGTELHLLSHRIRVLDKDGRLDEDARCFSIKNHVECSFRRRRNAAARARAPSACLPPSKGPVDSFDIEANGLRAEPHAGNRALAGHRQHPSRALFRDAGTLPPHQRGRTAMASVPLKSPKASDAVFRYVHGFPFVSTRRS